MRGTGTSSSVLREDVDMTVILYDDGRIEIIPVIYRRMLLMESPLLESESAEV